ncbi:MULTISPECIES: DUF2398 family protein [unclassified Crossiella]|uniref:DUF2398 family protein n=1 Tax=unclassified Crossiella TaxID=2620835 RepID=UPI0020001541|nr:MULTISPECIES: DUF2398 family protein [unclassified Crossiella]MCK2245204.1 TIGR02678 family protein [Crossiella sp. S99.2]MCK2258874.1 TIGR02678 family protein [Crossiella sp. S99.1]
MTVRVYDELPQAVRLHSAQRAWLGLLAFPILTYQTNPRLYRAVLDNRGHLTRWAARVGYRLTTSVGVVRLHRDPAGPELTAAPVMVEPPSRRELVLRIVLAAACEEITGTTTVQYLSDAVRAASVNPACKIKPYNPHPDKEEGRRRARAERQTFLKAVDHLVDCGVLIRRTSDDGLLRQWEDEGQGIGGGFEVNSDALLQFIDPHTVHRVFTVEGQDLEEVRTATRRQRMLRHLLEDTALLYGDLHPDDADYARAQRSSLAAAAAEMSGGTVEVRAEGLLLRLPQDCPAGMVLAFPGSKRSAWFALNILDGVLTAGPSPDGAGRITVTSEVIDQVTAEVRIRCAEALTEDLRGGTGSLRTAVEPILQALGVVRISANKGWTVLPTAARFRNPRLSYQPALPTDELLPDPADSPATPPPTTRETDTP